MQKQIIKGRMNIACGVTNQFGKITLREEYTYRLVVPQTVCAETVQTERETTEQNQIRKNFQISDHGGTMLAQDAHGMKKKTSQGFENLRGLFSIAHQFRAAFLNRPPKIQ